MLCLIFFAFTTILGWNYYGERCLEYFTNGNKAAVKCYRWLYIAAVFIGPYLTVAAVWTIADIFNALMALPNIVALLALSGVVAKETRAYFHRISNTVFCTKSIDAAHIPWKNSPHPAVPDGGLHFTALYSSVF